MKRLGHPEPMHRSGAQEEPPPFTPWPQSADPLPEGDRDQNRLETPTSVAHSYRVARPVRNAVWYAPAHGKGKAKKTPRPPLQGEPRPPPQRRPGLASRPRSARRITYYVPRRELERARTRIQESRRTTYRVSRRRTGYLISPAARPALLDTASEARLTSPVGSSGRRLRWDRWMPRRRRRRRPGR